MGTAIALGNFDGVHLAHAALIQRTAAYAKENALTSLVYVFEPHPKTLLCPGAEARLLMTAKTKARRLMEAGIESVHLERRGMEILSLSPEAFVEDILHKELGATYVTAGFNYRFGKKASGDAALLTALCNARGMVCRIMEPMEIDGKSISSTRLRSLLENGEIEAYNALSFAPYTVSGTVRKGKQLGRTIGFPTINIDIPKVLLLPKKGVYISRTYFDGKWYKSVTNIGQNPTVEAAPPRAESHLLQFSGDVYGKEAEVELLAFIRPEQKFQDLATLCKQIEKDITVTKQYFNK